MQPKKELNFTGDWGGKLDKDEFITTRGQDTLFILDDVLPINRIQDKDNKMFPFKKCSKGLGKINSIEWRRICDYSDDEIIADIGLEGQENLDGKNVTNQQERFLMVLERWYKDKPWWMGKYTIVQKLTIEKCIPEHRTIEYAIDL